MGTSVTQGQSGIASRSPSLRSGNLSGIFCCGDSGCSQREFGSDHAREMPDDLCGRATKPAVREWQAEQQDRNVERDAHREQRSAALRPRQEASEQIQRKDEDDSEEDAEQYGDEHRADVVQEPQHIVQPEG